MPGLRNNQQSRREPRQFANSLMPGCRLPLTTRAERANMPQPRLSKWPRGKSIGWAIEGYHPKSMPDGSGHSFAGLRNFAKFERISINRESKLDRRFADLKRIMLRIIATLAVSVAVGRRMAGSGAFILVTLTLLLAGCGGGRSVAQYEAEQRAAVDKQDDSTCRSYGTQPGSSNYVACRMNIANNRAAAQRQQDAADSDLENGLVQNAIRTMSGH
jgi:hypothetical protein